MHYINKIDIKIIRINYYAYHTQREIFLMFNLPKFCKAYAWFQHHLTHKRLKPVDYQYTCYWYACVFIVIQYENSWYSMAGHRFCVSTNLAISYRLEIAYTYVCPTVPIIILMHFMYQYILIFKLMMSEKKINSIE